MYIGVKTRQVGVHHSAILNDDLAIDNNQIDIRSLAAVDQIRN